MKAMVETCFASRRRHAGTAAAALPLADGKVCKQGSGGEAEMQALFLKLKELVPVPASGGGGRKMSRTEILQCVIDYIFDLEVTLESHPLCHQVEASDGVVSDDDDAESSVEPATVDSDECCDVSEA